ncbi:MAG: HAD-IIA family hydrolase [Victivallales bacterium]|nr:HAD-IIA family hydrolase [Victivallales bacterium]
MVKTRLLCFDLDGTLYLDGVPYPGAIAVIEKLRASDLEYCFVTNNSSIAPPDYCEKLRRIGFPLEPRNVMSSSEAACHMLRTLGVGPEVYLLGTEKFRRWMEGQGFVHSFQNAQALLIAFDKELTYQKLHEATQCVLRGLPIYATHPDPVCPPDLPDAGMLLEYFKAVRPGTIIQGIAGKPHHWLAEVLCERFQVEPAEMVMVGDRVGTDLAFAQNNGMRSMLTLNGAHLPTLGNVKPTVIVPHIAQLLDEFWPRNLGW